VIAELQAAGSPAPHSGLADTFARMLAEDAPILGGLVSSNGERAIATTPLRVIFVFNTGFIGKHWESPANSICSTSCASTARRTSCTSATARFHRRRT